VEWAPNLTQEWQTSIGSLGNLSSTATVNRVAVPMFYRVRQYGPAFSIPDAGTNMQMDGIMNEWSNIPPVIVNGGANDIYGLAGDAIDKAYIAKDTNFMYFAVSITDGVPLSGADSGHFHFQFEIPHFSSCWHTFVVFPSVGQYQGNWWVNPTSATGGGKRLFLTCRDT
jgi:hypothetical protein